MNKPYIPKKGDKIRIKKTAWWPEWFPVERQTEIFTVVGIENEHIQEYHSTRFNTDKVQNPIDEYRWWFEYEDAEPVMYQLPEELFTL